MMFAACCLQGFAESPGKTTVAVQCLEGDLDAQCMEFASEQAQKESCACPA